MNKNFRSLLIAIITFAAGLYFFLEFVLPEKIGSFEFGLYHDQISRGVQVVGTMALGLGLINILRVHGGNILKTKKGWFNSLALIFGLFLMFAIEGTDFVNSMSSVNAWQEFDTLSSFSADIAKKNIGKPTQAISRLETAQAVLAKTPEAQNAFLALSKLNAEQKRLTEVPFLAARVQSKEALTKLIAAYRLGEDKESLEARHKTFEGSLKTQASFAKEIADHNYQSSRVKKTAKLLFDGFFVPLGSAMFSLLAFYIATAAYRTFRIRTVEAGIMMLAALIVMLGQIPHGPIYVSEDLPAIRLWLLKYLSTPAFRAIYFGSMIAGLAMAVRMWLSLEKSPLSSFDEE